MSEKKPPTVDALQKEITRLKKKLSETTYVLQESLNIEKKLQAKNDKEIEDLKKLLTQSRADYQRACDIARHLSRAVNILTEKRYE